MENFQSEVLPELDLFWEKFFKRIGFEVAKSHKIDFNDKGVIFAYYNAGEKRLYTEVIGEISEKKYDFLLRQLIDEVAKVMTVLLIKSSESYHVFKGAVRINVYPDGTKQFNHDVAGIVFDGNAPVGLCEAVALLILVARKEVDRPLPINHIHFWDHLNYEATRLVDSGAVSAKWIKRITLMLKS